MNSRAFRGDLWRCELLKDDPELTWYWRAVGVAEYACGGVDFLDQMVRIQGVVPRCWVPRQHIEDVIVAVEARAITADIFGLSISTDASLSLARKSLATEKLALILRWCASAQTAPMRFWRHWLRLPLTAGSCRLRLRLRLRRCGGN